MAEARTTARTTDWARATKYFLLWDFFLGFKVGFKYFFAPKATLNYPHEKGPLSPRFHAPKRWSLILREGAAYLISL